MRVIGIVVLAGCGFQSQASAADAVGPGQPIDAQVVPDAVPEVDAVASFDYARCPGSYTAALPGPTRYRVLIDGHRAWEQSDACNADLPGATHLVILETAAELHAVEDFLETASAGIARNSLWIGGVQRSTATRPDDAWLGFDGAPLPALWANNEPQDGGGTENDHREQFAMLEGKHDGLSDLDGNTNSGALCECDGKPLAAEVIGLIEANRLAH